MTDEPLQTDGGTPASAERDVRRAGERPPDVPARTTVEDLLPRLLDDTEEIETGYHIRARLSGDDPDRAAEQLVKALERKVTVVGTTLDAGVDPADPQLDVLIECDHTMSQVATALARVAPVDGAVVLDVTAECEHVIEDQQEAEEADAADANDVFSELQEQVSQADYDQVVDELEDVSFPGGPDPDDEVDLEAETGVELDDDESATAEAGDPELEPDRETIELDNGGMDPDDVSAKELFGEADEESDDGPSVPVGEADETAIEEAVRTIEEQPAADADDAEAPAADDAPAAEAADAPTADDPAEAAPEEAAADGPAVDTDAPATADEETADAAEDGPATPATPAATDDEGATPAARTDGAAVQDDGTTNVEATVDALVRALESGEVGPDRRQRLREALGIESTHSLDVRLEYVQKRVDNLAAYTDAWEAFLEEEGSGDRFTDEVRSRLDELEQQVESTDGAADPELVEQVEALEATVDDLASAARVASVEQRLDDLEADHEDLADQHEADVDRIEDRLETFGDAIEKLKESLRQLVEWRETVNGILRG